MRKNRSLSFRDDLRNKFIRFAIIPILMLGIFGSVIVYNAEENTLINNHKQLLTSIDNRIKNFYGEIQFLCSAIHKELNTTNTSGDSDLIEDALIYNKNIYSIYYINIRTDSVNVIDRTLHVRTKKVDPEIIELIEPLRGKQRDTYHTDAYYSHDNQKVLLSCVMRKNDHEYYVFNIAPERLRVFIKSLSRKDPGQSVILVNRKGEYICNTLHPETVMQRKNFFKTGAYFIAVQNAEPFELTEFPAHYEKGDSVFKGLLDEDHFITYAPQKEMGWLILIRDYYDNLDPFLNRMLAVAIVFVSLSIILMFLVIKITTDKIMNPVEHLIDRIHRFAKGDTKSFLTVDSEKTYPIFVSLIQSFNNMQKQIHERREELNELNKNLENIVAEKTRSLEELNRNLEKIIDKKVMENLEIQRRLTLNEKLASMGEMIGNIAHQWRQPLSVITMLATGMKTKKELGVLLDEELYHSCDQINENAQYLSRTIDDFRDFIRGDKTRSVFDIERILIRFRSLIESQVTSYRIIVETDVDKGLMISGYPNDLVQVWINIFNNAKDAFELNKVEKRYFMIEAHFVEGSIVTTLTDNAGGILEEVMDRIFEPYFTTKHPSQGTGLGLHMAYKLIAAMSGEISAENVTVVREEMSYIGARFTIRLPAYKEQDPVNA